MGGRRSSPRGVIALALITTWLTTGANFIGFKLALETLPPLTMMTARLFAAASIMVVVARVRQPLKWPGPRQVRSTVIVGTLLLVLGQGGIVWGVRQLPAGFSAVFASSSPVFLVLLEYVFGRDPLSARRVIGILLGFGGLILMSTFSTGTGANQASAIAFVLAGSASWALGSMVERRLQMPSDPILSGTLQMLWAGCAMLGLALLSGEISRFDVSAISARSYVGLSCLVIFGLVIGFAAFVWLNGATSPTLANTFHYVSPIVAMAAAFWLFGEPIGWSKAASALVVLAGVAFIVGGGSEKSGRKGSRK
jgi:drug/metabolite transporter (DMT)-like permease